MLTRQKVVDAWRRVALTARAWLGLAAFDLALSTGFSRAHERVRRTSVRLRRANAPSTDLIVWAVDEACVWYVKRAACLQRSAVATRLLRRHGVAASLVVGYRAIPFESHAWVEVDGCIVNDLPQYKKYFIELERL